MTVFRVAVYAPFTATLQVDHNNRWSVIDPGTMPDGLIDDLPAMAELVGERSPGLPDSTRYPNGLLAFVDGELLSVKPPFESDPHVRY